MQSNCGTFPGQIRIKGFLAEVQIHSLSVSGGKHGIFLLSVIKKQ